MTMKKAWDVFNKLLESMVSILFSAIIVVVFIEVICRYVLQAPAMWTEEIARYLLVLVTVLGVGKVSRTGDHLGVFFIRDNLKGRVKTALYIFNILVTIVFLLIMTYAVGKAYIQNYDLTGVLVLWFKLRWLYLGMGIGCVMMLVYAIRDLGQACVAFVKNIPIEADGYSAPFPNGIGGSTESKEGAD